MSLSNSIQTQEPIAIIGIGCRLPGDVNSIDSFWQVLKNGEDVIRQVPAERWDLDFHFNSDPLNPLTQHVKYGGFVDNIQAFDPAFFGITPREAKCMDPQQRMLLEVSWRTIENAGYPSESLKGKSVGVYVGISSSDYSSLLWISNEDYLTPNNEPFILSGNTGCIAANRISYFFDFKGPSFTVDTACSSSLVSVHLACESLLRGETDMALAGGVQALIHPGIQMSFCKAGLLSPDGRCKSFDAEANGYVRSEGAGMILLKPLSRALADEDQIYATICGTAINSDGRSQGISAPSRRSQKECITQAYKRAGIPPSSSQYVEAHGTGTRQGDPIELRAIGETIGADRKKDKPLRIGSVKTNLGHGETAAGITGLIKAALCIKKRKLPPSIHYKLPNPSINFEELGLRVQTQYEDFPNNSQPLIVSVSSFGFGGTNAHAVLREHLSSNESIILQQIKPKLHLFYLTAKSSLALDQLIIDYVKFINLDPKIDIYDLCINTNIHRSKFNYTFIAIVETIDELRQQLSGKAKPNFKGEILPSPLKDTEIESKITTYNLSQASDLEAISNLIVSGSKINFTNIYKNSTYKRISLPGHPFLKKSFWWTPKDENQKQSTLWLEFLNKNIEPLGDSIIPVCDFKKEDLPGSKIHYKCKIDINHTTDLCDHIIRDFIIFPAAGYVELLLKLKSDSYTSTRFSKLELLRPLKLENRVLFLNGLLEDNKFEFYSRFEKNQSWKYHGKVFIDEYKNNNKHKNYIPNIPDKILEISPSEFYSKLQQIGLKYGDKYRSIEKILSTEGECWSEIVRHNDAPDRALIDGCFQSVAACMYGQDSLNQIFLPVAIEEFSFSKWPLPDKLSCYSKLILSEDSSHLLFDLILESDRKPLAYIKGLKLRKLDRSLINLIFPSKNISQDIDLFETDWFAINPDSFTEKVSTGSITIINNGKLKLTTLIDWSLTENIDIQLEDLEKINYIVSSTVIYSPDLELVRTEEITKNIINLLNSISTDHVKSFVLILYENSPITYALSGLIRTAIVEMPFCEFSIFYLSPESELNLCNDKWNTIWELLSSHTELRYVNNKFEISMLKRLEDRFSLISDGSDRLEGLIKHNLNQYNLLADEVEVAVEATGLNFRDVINALGLLKEHNTSLGLDDEAKLPFGGECVGRIVNVGENIDTALIGRRVVAALTIGSLASHVVARHEFCKPLPTGMSIEEGASFSTVFLTAYYGLISLARLQKGETVLVHSAAGGVGQAAIQVIKNLGGRIIATASEKKHSYLLNQGVDVVFDSRSIDFADQVLDYTHGNGVDIVLNSLKGKGVDASFKSLSKGGRFIELGKLDIWTQQKVKECRPDSIYLPFDLLEVSESQPKVISDLLVDIINDFNNGKLKKIPLEIWPIEKHVEAFRYMAQASHIGKIVINQPVHKEPILITKIGSYLITGAFGALGIQLIHWLVGQGATSLILVSRSIKETTPEAQDTIRFLENNKIDYFLIAYDLSSTPLNTSFNDSLLTRIKNLSLNKKELVGIFHCAGVTSDASLADLNTHNIESVITTKVNGWMNLESIASDLGKIKFIIGFSSIASLLGSPGQASYAAANGAIDGFCASNRDQIVRLSIQWGPWSGAGMALGKEQRFERIGIGMLEPSKAINMIGRLLNRGQSGVVAVANNNWDKVKTQASSRQKHWFDLLIQQEGPSSADLLWLKLKKLPDAERLKFLLNLLRDTLAKIMANEYNDELVDYQSIDPTESLFEIGIDSLMAVEFAAVVNADFGIRLELDSFSEEPTLQDLALISLTQLSENASQDINKPLLDLSKEANLPNNFSVPSSISNNSPGDTILVTGVTGFLGAYLLAGQLNRWPNLKIRCLVRANSRTNGFDRIKSNLEKYNLWNSEWKERLEPVIGDLSMSSFGLSSSDFASLSKGLGGILHNGAFLSQMSPYSQLAPVNVNGTKEVLLLATQDTPIRVEMISSVSVFEATKYRNKEIFEDDDLSDWEGIYLGYSQTKWVSDRLVYLAGKSGLPVTIYRPPLIGGHSITGHWNQGDLVQRLLHGCLSLGMIPQIDWELDLVPVDYVANAVTSLAWDQETKGQCFHLQHPHPLMLNDLLTNLLGEGNVLQLVSMDEWLSNIASNPNNSLYPLQTFFKKRWGSKKLTYPQLNSRGTRSRPSCVKTSKILHNLNIKCPDYVDLIKPWSNSLLINTIQEYDS